MLENQPYQGRSPFEKAPPHEKENKATQKRASLNAGVESRCIQLLLFTRGDRVDPIMPSSVSRPSEALMQSVRTGRRNTRPRPVAADRAVEFAHCAPPYHQPFLEGCFLCWPHRLSMQSWRFDLLSFPVRLRAARFLELPDLPALPASPNYLSAPAPPCFPAAELAPAARLAVSQRVAMTVPGTRKGWSLLAWRVAGRAAFGQLTDHTPKLIQLCDFTNTSN